VQQQQQQQQHGSVRTGIQYEGPTQLTPQAVNVSLHSSSSSSSSSMDRCVQVYNMKVLHSSLHRLSMSACAAAAAVAATAGAESVRTGLQHEGEQQKQQHRCCA
jgi:hypothetical protein